MLPLVCSATNNGRCHNWRRTSRWAATPVNGATKCKPRTQMWVGVLLSVADDSESSVAAASARGAAQDCSHATISHRHPTGLPCLALDGSPPEILSGESPNLLRAAQECSIIGRARALGASCAGALPAQGQAAISHKLQRGLQL